MDSKKPVSLRLSEGAREILSRLSKAKGISRTAVIELAIRDYAEAEDNRTRQTAGPRDDDH